MADTDAAPQNGGGEDIPLKTDEGKDQSPNGVKEDAENGGDPPKNNQSCWAKLWIWMKKYWWCVVIAVGLLILILGLGLGLGLRGRRGAPAKATAEPTPKEVTPKVTPTPSHTAGLTPIKESLPSTTVDGAHVPRLDGSVDTTENYTAAMADPTSADFQKLASKFTTEMDSFYADSPYSAFYNGTTVTSIMGILNDQAQIIFHVLLSEVTAGEGESEYTALDGQLSGGSLGEIMILGHSLTEVLS